MGRGAFIVPSTPTGASLMPTLSPTHLPSPGLTSCIAAQIYVRSCPGPNLHRCTEVPSAAAAQAREAGMEMGMGGG